MIVDKEKRQNRKQKQIKRQKNIKTDSENINR